MHTIEATNVSSALAQALDTFSAYSVAGASRNGPVRVLLDPVAITYRQPWNNVLLSPTRNANPFFHLMEAMWMLAGRNDVEFVAQYVKRMAEYSDDGKTFHGAYGYRWRQFFGYDQLDWIIDELRANPTSRRCVLAMWNAFDTNETHTPPDQVVLNGPWSDLYVATHGGKDVPCNTHAYFLIHRGALHMTVCNRSNDAIWGAFGANAVHFSFLQMYLASAIGVKVGPYVQFSNNLHIYTDVCPEETWEDLAGELRGTAPPPTAPFVASQAHWDNVVQMATVPTAEMPVISPSPLRDTIVNARLAWTAYKNHGIHSALSYARQIADPAWRRACVEWLERKNKK